jgi:hypothetical protein
MSSFITTDYFNAQMATLGLKSTFTVAAETLATLIVEASDWVEGYCDRKFEIADHVETFHLPWRKKYPEIILNHFPVTSVASLAWEDETGRTGSYGTDLFWIDESGTMTWKNPDYYGFFGSLRYTVDYEAGYATIPPSVQRATALKVANLMQPQYQGIQDREIFMVSNLEAMIVDLLEPFRRERLG